MDISAELVADLATLTEALDDPDQDLEVQLRNLVADVRHAVTSFLGLRLTIVLDSAEVSFAVADEASMSTAAIATSLRIPLAALSPAPSGGLLVLHAATPGAFVDLAADLSYALGLPSAALRLDEDVGGVLRTSGIAGLETQAVVNQAAGVLIDRGYPPEAAREELARLAARDGGHVHRAAEALIHDAVRDADE